MRCPGALNDRIVTSGVLALAAVAVVSAGELVASRSARRMRPTFPGWARRLRLLGTAVTVLGAALTIGGLTGIALLIADPHSELFLYVSRPIILLTGLLLLLPAILLIALGRGTSLMADYLSHAEASRETP